ncbi:MAG TPA: hypothetical protein VKU60_11935 [Chloroflexota bacterium]|nr:hypothetical protein [Chloroflexota bacterium]
MDRELEDELATILARLREQPENHLPDEFKMLARETIEPALEEIARRMQASGYPCEVEEIVDQPDHEAGQSVCFLIDPKYNPTAHPLCFRLTPGEALVRMEMPSAGAAYQTQKVPFTQITRDRVQRVAVEFLKHVV